MSSGAEHTTPSAARVLVVDDEVAVRTTIARALRDTTSSVVVAEDANEALQKLEQGSFDVIVSDIHMPGMTGLALIDALRARDLDVPIILVTGAPSVETAASAVELGAFRYLTKPFDLDTLRRAVAQAVHVGAATRAKRQAHDQDRAGSQRTLLRALASLRMEYQPIVAADTRVTVGHEALMRTSEPTLATPMAVLSVAERLGALHLLGRRIRGMVAADLTEHPGRTWAFVNLHPSDLADADLFDPRAPLSRHARRVVLELTERASLEGVADLDVRLDRLRKLGFRIAVDDLGAGYAGLSYFASVRPELVKIDLSLVRGVDHDPVKQRVITSLVHLGNDLGMELVAEGVETIAERDTVIRLGCTYVQGHLLARPGPPFPVAAW